MADGSDDRPRELSSISAAARRVTSRRRFLASAAAVGVVVGASTYASGRQDNLIELVAAASGWEGQTPAAIEGETNPTLTFRAGQDYEVVWENVDGLPHNFVIENADGGQVFRTERKARAGAIQTVRFTATEGMAGYYCEIHPDSMAGDVEVPGTTPTPTPTETPDAPDLGGEFAATLAGGNVVPPVETDAVGEATFTAEQRGDGGALRYRLDVSGPWNGCVTEAHVHLGVPGENGPVVAVLFDALEPVDDAEGTLAAALLSADDLVGPLAGEGLIALADRMAAGEAYVDVHTTAHPSGEIRGEVAPISEPYSG